VEVAGICDRDRLHLAVAKAKAVFHFAAQVAVTTSVANPLEDFLINAQGTLLLLEELRALADPPPLLFTSTNKVYGALSKLSLRATASSYQPEDARIRSRGIGEDRPLDLHSPYGCSKGAGDQYVLDYARTFGIPAVVFRMSCIYGPHQNGNEDQGWVAHFLIRALDKKQITIYGDGRQVRDLLYIGDLVNAFLLALENARNLSGQAFNIGGGPENALSLLDVLDLIESITGERPSFTIEPPRIGDQRYYVTDSEKFRSATRWVPEVSVRRGIELLHGWLTTQRAGFPAKQALPRRQDEVRTYQSPLVIQG